MTTYEYSRQIKMINQENIRTFVLYTQKHSVTIFYIELNL